MFELPVGWQVGGNCYVIKLTDRGASTFYFKNFCPGLRPRPRVIWFVRTITLESLNQSEPKFSHMTFI